MWRLGLVGLGQPKKKHLTEARGGTSVGCLDTTSVTPFHSSGGSTRHTTHQTKKQKNDRESRASLCVLLCTLCLLWLLNILEGTNDARGSVSGPRILILPLLLALFGFALPHTPP